MKLSKLLLMLVVTQLFMAQKCIPDSEENNAADDNLTDIRYDQVETVTKTMAIEDWELFLKQSQNSIDNAEANIGNLEIRLDDADTDSKPLWQETCDFSNLALLKLKAKRIKRNKEFEKELTTYDPSVYQKNEAFETQFDNEMQAIDKKLETTFEKIRSGYYK